MKNIVIIIALSFLWSQTFSQYVATWTGKSSLFQIQRSSDGKKWTTVATTKSNTYTGTGATYYWRVKFDSSYSDTVWVYALATVTNAKLKILTSTALISWTGNTETNMLYYTIESISNSTTVMKHGGSYTITVPKIGNTYEIVAHYKNGHSSILKVFNP